MQQDSLGAFVWNLPVLIRMALAYRASRVVRAGAHVLQRHAEIMLTAHLHAEDVDPYHATATDGRGFAALFTLFALFEALLGADGAC